MCFHSRAEYDAYVAARQKNAQREKAAKGHEKSKNKYALIVLRDVKGEWVAGWHCDPRDAQDVANTILDLKTWHAGEFKYVDMSDVDKERARLKLPTLDADGLPMPNRKARESADEEIDAEFSRADMDRKVKILLSTSEKTRTALGKAADERLAQKIAARNRERAELAAAMGMTLEELNIRESAEVKAAR